MDDIKDFLNGFIIMGQPDKDTKQWMYLGEASIYEYGTSCTWESKIERGGGILAYIFPTKKEAVGIKMLISGTVTNSDYNVLQYIHENPGVSFEKLQSLLRQNKEVAESINKLLRNVNIESFNSSGSRKGQQVHFKITPNGITTLHAFKNGKRDVNTTMIKVISFKQALKNIKIIENSKLIKRTD